MISVITKVSAWFDRKMGISERLLVGLPLISFVVLTAYPDEPVKFAYGMELCLAVIFVACYIAGWIDKKTTIPFAVRITAFIVLVLSILLSIWVRDVWQLQLLFLVTVAYLIPFYLHIFWATLFLILCHLGASVACFLFQPSSMLMPLWPIFLYFGVEVLIMTTTYNWIRERRAREQLGFVNNKLEATQQLLEESSKQEERLRISRNLHDVIGHHLTGLNMQLEHASYITEGRAKEKVDQAYAISRLLLADVRQVVSDMRLLPTMDLKSSLLQLTQASEKPLVNLDMPSTLNFDDARVAEALFCVVLEILNNCKRHSKASTLDFVLREDESGWLLQARDDCRSPVHLKHGNGLNGLRERIEQLNGTFEIDSSAGLVHRVAIPRLS